MNLRQYFEKLTFGVEVDYSMSRLTSFKVGGPCDYLVRPATHDELKKVIRTCYQQKVYYKILGRGTNILVRDRGIRGVVISLISPFDVFQREDEKRVKVGAALHLPHLTRLLMHEGLSGMEFASGIPGSVGGALIMNAGAYGHSIGDLVENISYISPQGEDIEISPQEAGFAYRTSMLKEKGGVIVAATFKLKKDDPDLIRKKIEEISQQRQKKQPWLPSAGSVFRNPSSAPAGELIESSGCKGWEVGGAKVSEKHANFIVNTGSARASDVLALISKVQHKVKERTGIELQLEVEVIGED